jgi:hypothetical protein
LAGDTITCGDKEFSVNSFNFGNPGSIDFEWVEINPLPGYADDLFSANINFTPSLVGVKTGFFDYNLKILDPKYRFDSVQLDSTVAVNANSPGKTSVIKSITGGPTLFSLDGAPDGPVPFQTPSPITVRDTWNVVSKDVLTNIKDTYTQQEVPGLYVTPDFTYKEAGAVVFIDGPHHGQPIQQRLDHQKRQALSDAGITVVVFTQDTTSWPGVLSEYSWLFGEGRRSPRAGADAPDPGSSASPGSPGSLGEALDQVFKEHSTLFGEEQR